MENLPFYITALFILTTLVTVFLFYKATQYSTPFLLIVLLWLGVQAVISRSGFYTLTYTMPPRFLLLIAPPVLFIFLLFFTNKGRHFIDNLNLPFLTLLHSIRIPVELVLFWLFVHKMVPQLMTFEGRNFDILSGISAPIIFYFGFIKKSMSRKFMLLWNFICLGLLLNIVIHAILAAPFPFQRFAFDQPNIAVLYFPFVWLPCCIVPLVLFSHLAAIRQLLLQDKKVLSKNEFTKAGWA